MAEQPRDIAGYLTEINMGVAVLTALVLHLLEKSGSLDHEAAAETIRKAADSIPDEYGGDPRYAPLIALRVLMDDPELRHALPFPWLSN